MTLVFVNNPPDAWWEMSMPHSRVFCVAAQYFSLFCSRISLTGLAADERGVHNPSWKNCIAQHTCSRIAWLSAIRFGLFLNKNAAFLGLLLYLTCIQNGDFWETTFLWNPFLQCFVQNYCSWILKWKSVCRKFILLHMINRDTWRQKWKHNQTGLLFLPGEQSGIKICLIWRWNIPVHIILQFYCNKKYRFAWEL